jgi:selenocysteine-specific elongation factor
MIIGVAGHIDHGKTALIKALTGVSGDRLKEEKARGITIDLGFAYLPTEAGSVLGFVDVPGHERFVHTMLAGASGIDFVLLTVAANDGVMPQTVEHLAIVDLLGLKRGLVALTKIDLVGPDRLAAVAGDIRSALMDTTLEGAEILGVSTLNGRGVDALRSRLVAVSGDRVDRSTQTRFRLAVDRVFTLPGAGLVVTGAVLSGSVRVGDRLEVSPSGLPARVRSLRAQNGPAEIGRLGDRCALNLVNPALSKEVIRRGDIVLDPELHAPTDRIEARLRILASEPKSIGQWFPVRLHHAAAEVGGRIVLLGDEPIPPGAIAAVQLVLDRPIAAASQDRFVIRDASAQRTIGGGQFVDLRPPLRRRRAPERKAQRDALAIADPATAVAALLAVPPFAWDLTAFARDRALAAAEISRLSDKLDLILLESGASKIAVSQARWRLFRSDLLEHLAGFHAESPDQQGVGREKLRMLLNPRLPPPVFVAALQMLARNGDLALDGAFVRLPTHVASLTPGDEESWSAIAPLLGGVDRFRPPRVRDIVETTGRAERDVRRLFKLAARLGWVDEVAHDHFFLRTTVSEMMGIVIEIAAEAKGGAIGAAQFRDRVANGRKVAIQIMEFFDRHGVTLRKGDLRRVNKHRLDLFKPLMFAGGEEGGESSLVGRSDFKSEWGSEPVSGGFDSRSLPPTAARTRS